MGQERGQGGLVMGGDPAHTQPRQGEDLGHTADGDALFVQVGDGGAPVVGLGQVAVDLVAEDVGAHAAGDGDDLLQQGRGHQRAGGVIGVVDADHLRVRRHQRLQLGQVGEVVVLLLQVHDGHLRADGLRNGVELLVGGHNADHPVSGGDEGAEHMVVGARRAVGGHHLMGLHSLVELADALAQGVAAHDVAVGQALGAEVGQKGLLIHAGQGEELVRGNGVHAGLRDVEASAHFIFIHPFFHGKGLDVHSVFSFSGKK